MTSPVDVTAERAQRIMLRASAVFHGVLAVFVAAAAGAVYLFVAPRAGLGAGVGAAVATAALLAVCARRVCSRRLPAELRIDAFGQVVAFDRAGNVLAHGRVTGCAQWSNLLLVLSVGPAPSARGAPLLIPADALDASSLRALSVLGRGAGGAAGRGYAL